MKKMRKYITREEAKRTQNSEITKIDFCNVSREK